MDRRRILLVVVVLVAALGAGLVFVYAQGADNRAQDKLQTTQVLVAQQQIAAGESASDAYNSGKIALASVPTQSVLTDATSDGTVFTDRVALTTIYPGEQLITDKFGTSDQVAGKALLTPPAGDFALQCPFSETGKVGSFTQPGDHVAVFVIPPATPVTTPNGGQAVPAVSAQVLLPSMLVLAIGATTVTPGQTGPDGLPLPASATTNLTLAVDQKQAETLLASGCATSSAGTTLYLGLLNDQSKVKRDVTLPGLGG